MQMLERHHAAAAAGLVALVDPAEMADAAEPGAIEDDELHPREMQAEAGMDARPEGGVAVELALDRNRPGVGIERLVPSDERQRREDAVAGAKLRAFEQGVLHDRARGRDDGMAGPQFLAQGGETRG